jgi:phage-related minor tail protein
LFGNAIKGMEDFLVDFLTKGKASVSDFINSMIADFTRMMVRKNITSPLAKAASDVNWGKLLGGLIPFANGGIMTNHGSVPLKAYSNGGIATSPQLALYGETSTPEAYVPLPDGRTIPVTMRGNNGGGNTTLIVKVENNSGNDISAEQISSMSKTNSRGELVHTIGLVMEGARKNVLGFGNMLKQGNR